MVVTLPVPVTRTYVCPAMLDLASGQAVALETCLVVLYLLGAESPWYFTAVWYTFIHFVICRIILGRLLLLPTADPGACSLVTVNIYVTSGHGESENSNARTYKHIALNTIRMVETFWWCLSGFL